MSAAPTVTTVLLAYGPEEWLEAAVRSVLASQGVEVDVVLVDNGCTSDAVDRVRGLPGVQVLTPGVNTGYAGGCDLGAAQARGDWLAFVNSDAEVAPDALRRLVAVAAEPGVGIATGSIRLAEAPATVNSAGNPLHFLGLVWAGGHGQPATAHAHRRRVACASGAGFVLSTTLWKELGGFAPEYFAYHEDTELSIRCWQRGLAVEYVPEAVVLHHYEFSRNARKLYLVERNRLVLLATTYERRTLLLLGPAIVGGELALLAAAVAGGWGRQKAAGWAWVWRHRRWVLERRRQLQGERTEPDGRVAHVITGRFDPTNVAAPSGVAVFNAVAGTYWRAARRLLRGADGRSAARAGPRISRG